MKRDVDWLRDERFDLLVLGGGITGAGVALDAVSRGLRVALIDKGDFASGTSSVSSKLVHGGLRYLEHGALPLVYEALHERQLLLRNAPHLVRPLRFIVPFYREARVPRWKWRVGLTLYDHLAGRSNLRRSRSLRVGRLREGLPALRPAGLLGAAEYHDAQMDDARLCLEVIRTAAARGACVANYIEAVAFERQASTITGVRGLDRRGGADFSIRARLVVNATGPWVDPVCRLAGDDAGPRLTLTKGVHVIVADQGLPAAFLLLHPADGRVLFVLPWMGRTLIGTTDTLTPEGPDGLGIRPEEVAYLLAAYNHHFARELTTADMLGSFAGLRPLVRARPGKPSSLSREFRLFASPSGLLTAAGGKFTTYRRMAATIMDEAARRLGCRGYSATRWLRLDGAPAEPWPAFAARQVAVLKTRHGLPETSACHLVNRYGIHATEVAAYLERNSALAVPIIAGEPDLLVELAYQREHEMAISPADHLLRRTRLGLLRPNLLTSPSAPLQAALAQAGAGTK